jgi:acetate kinase
MGTRCGDIDPALVPYLMSTEGLSAREVDRLMNQESGLLGLSERGSDMREILDGMDEGDDKCRLAFKVFCYRIKKYIGSYTAAIGGLDALVFTGGIGENSGIVREEICSGLEFMGIEIDERLNGDNQFSIGRGKVNVLVIPTNEELAIARSTIAVLKDHAPAGD